MSEQYRQQAYNDYLNKGSMGDGRDAKLNPTNVSYDVITSNPQMTASEIQRAQQVIQHRQGQGLDNSAQQRYLAGLQQAYSNQMQTPEGQIQHNAINSSQAYTQQQQAILEQRKQQQLSELESAFAQAVSEGQMSIRDAEKAYEGQVEQINKLAYQDAQVTNLTAQNRGIQNSQQMIGLQQGDNYRNNGFRQDALTERDTRIMELQNRLKQLSLDKDLAVSGVNSDYSTGLLQAQGEANQQLSNQMFEFNSSNYTMNKQQAFTVENMSLQQKYQLEQMARAHGYDLNKMSVQQQNEFARMAQQQSYTNANRSADFASQIAMQREQNTMERELASFAQQDAMYDEQQKYIEGSPQWQLEKDRLQAELDAKRADQLNQVGTEMMAQNAPIYPIKPTRKEFNSLWNTTEEEQHEFELAMDDYDEKLDAYNRWMKQANYQQ